MAVVGAPFDDELATRAGSVYVLGWSGMQWVEQAKLFAEDAADGVVFGWSVAISPKGDTIIVGRADNTGAAYIFDQSNANDWVNTKKLLPSAEKLAEGPTGFGSSVGISDDGNAVIVGAPSEDKFSFGECKQCFYTRGAAYIFDRNNVDWLQTIRLIPANLEPESFKLPQ